MRRRFVSDEKREDIIRLRQNGSGWLNIETMTGIPRRTAKQIFEESQQRQTEEETRTARRQVVADLFQSHLCDLIGMAGAITASLLIPSSRDQRDGDDVFNNMLKSGIRNRSIAGQVTGAEQADVNRRQNRLLLDSLKQHTRDKIDWQTLDDWRTARNEWQVGMEKIRSTIMTLFRNFIKQDNNKAESAIRIGDELMGRMVDGIVQATYRAAVDGKLDRADEYINTREHQGKMVILFGENASTIELIVESRELADKALALCRQVVANLTKGKESETLESMARSLKIMKVARDVLVEELDELMITPLIVRTKCDICPA